MSYFDSSFVTVRARKNLRLIGVMLISFGFGLVITSIFVSKAYNLVPCTLCVLQRITYIVLGFLGVCLLIYQPKKTWWRKFAICKVLIVAAIGAGLATYQIYLQHSPFISCSPKLEIMINSWSIAKWMPVLFKASGECGRIDWVLMGLSIPEWSAISFYSIVICALVYIFKRS